MRSVRMRGAGVRGGNAGRNTLAQPQPTSRSARRWSYAITIAMQLFCKTMRSSADSSTPRTAANDGDIDLTVRAQISRIARNRLASLVKTARLKCGLSRKIQCSFARRVERLIKRCCPAPLHHQRVIRDFALRHQQFALSSQLGNGDDARFAIDIHHRPQLELETMITRMSQ